MKQIPLTKGMIALVDDSDFESVSRYKWHAYKARNTFYARRSFRSPKQGVQLMHTFLTGFRRTDHENRNGLDNRRDNLRECTSSQNSANQEFTPNSTGYRGVSKQHDCARWYARITHNGKEIYLGTYKNPEEAGERYRQASLELFGEFSEFHSKGEAPNAN